MSCIPDFLFLICLPIGRGILCLGVIRLFFVYFFLLFFSLFCYWPLWYIPLTSWLSTRLAWFGPRWSTELHLSFYWLMRKNAVFSLKGAILFLFNSIFLSAGMNDIVTTLKRKLVFSETFFIWLRSMPRELGQLQNQIDLTRDEWLVA